MGLGIGMQNAGSFVGAASQANQAAQDRAEVKPDIAKPAQSGWKCACGADCTGKFCSQCGKPKPVEESWTCACGAFNKGNFCSECGKARPKDSQPFQCAKCGYTAENPGGTPKFCPNCGAPANPEA